MNARTAEAVDTRGRSEVERHLSQALPARVIELATSGDPRVTLRSSAQAHQDASVPQGLGGRSEQTSGPDIE